jgi:hypothetical protein
MVFERSNGSETISGTDNLSASNFGGKIGITVEWLRETKASWALDVGLGYRFLTLTPVHAVQIVDGGGGGSGTLLDNDGKNAYVDFSGFYLSADLRFF